MIFSDVPLLGTKPVTLPRQPQPLPMIFTVVPPPGAKPVTLPQEPQLLPMIFTVVPPSGAKPVTLPQEPQPLPVIFTAVPPSGAKPVTHNSRQDCCVNTVDEKTSQMGINGCMVWCQGNLSVKMATPAVALPRLTPR